ncbi:hypothetical protein HK097_005750 [Rhizophlyctis rosea]|uniref:Uncharacterized protein n=1 Tax=Rhizophlyctis rosea TaxID=64517 RepID=A0AAD5X4S7_9FUNG|nr:hypothetical protein HK097_005750 [Rhizophlyctis rosea]
MPADVLTATDIAKYAAHYNALRGEKGHFDGGDYLKDIDGYGGKKHRALDAIGRYYAEKGKNRPAKELLRLLGKPDEIIPKIEATTVGPKSVSGPEALTGGLGTGLEEAEDPLGPGVAQAPKEAGAENAVTGSYFAVYYWRGKHDYIWFEIHDKSGQELVKNYGWYQSIE